MQSIFLLLITTSVVTFNNFEGCRNTPTNTKAIRGASLLYHIPYLNADGTQTDINNMYEVYQSGDINLYKFNYRYDSLTNDVLELSETRNRFLVHHKDSTFGYLYDPFGLNPESRIPVDSMKQFRFENPQWDTISTMTIDSTFRTAQGNLVNVYHLPSTHQYTGGFTYYFYYTDSLKGVRESFSKTLENIHRKKLYKIRMVTHPFYYEPYKMMLPAMEAYYEMSEIKAGKQEEVEGYFRKYEKLMGN